MKILFLTHQTSRTGAPMVLLHFLKWIKINQPNQEIHCIAIEGGELEEEFKMVSNDYMNLSTIKKSNTNLIKEIKKKSLKKIGFHQPALSTKDQYIKKVGTKHFDLIYVNTVVCLPVAVKLKTFAPEIKHILHVHELKNMIVQLLPKFESYLKNIDFYIAVSDKVKKSLINNYNISPKDVEVVYEFTNISFVENNSKSNSFIIGGSGSINFRKGVDLFISVAAYIKRNYPEANIKFIWVGSGNPHFTNMLKEDIKKTGLEDSVHMVGKTDNPEQYYSKFDMFLMTSREDPFPLVCIEAGMLRKPIICFKNATGTEEILKKGGGKIIPYLDHIEMAKAVIVYYGNESMLKEDGEKAFELFSEFSPEKQCPKLFKLLENIL